MSATRSSGCSPRSSSPAARPCTRSLVLPAVSGPDPPPSGRGTPAPAVRPPVQLLRVAWERCSRGLSLPRTEHSPAQVAAAVALVLPRDSGFGHLTSALLRAWWLPNRLPRHVLLATTRSGVHVQ